MFFLQNMCKGYTVKKTDLDFVHIFTFFANERKIEDFVVTAAQWRVNMMLFI